MIELVSDARSLSAILERSTLPAGFRWRRHPDPAARALELRARGRAAEQLAVELAETNGRRYWMRGRWRTARKQLTLPGVC